MQTTLRWKRNFFSNLLSIHSEDRQVGELREKPFAQISEGELHGKKYSFKTKGFLNQYTEIIDSIENKVIGEIHYSSWMTKATISIDSKKSSWKYDNMWNTKWSIFNSEGIDIKYSGSSTSGQVESNIDDELLLLSGLVVTNYYWQLTMIIIFIVLIPILIS